MTYEEALWRLKDHFRVHRKEDKTPHPLLEQAIKLMYKAVEKQIPKKPINETGYYRDNKCPSCFKPIKSGKGSSSHYRNNWCNNCGQAIRWE